MSEEINRELKKLCDQVFEMSAHGINLIRKKIGKDENYSNHRLIIYLISNIFFNLLADIIRKDLSRENKKLAFKEMLSAFNLIYETFLDNYVDIYTKE